MPQSPEEGTREDAEPQSIIAAPTAGEGDAMAARSPRRIKRNTIVFVAAVLAVSVVAACLFVNKVRERQPFVSEVVGGYQYRCTLSTYWQRKQVRSAVASGTQISSTFSASPSPIREWISAHIFHQAPAKGSSVVRQQQLIMGTLTAHPAPNIAMRSGYPELDLRGLTTQGIKVLPGRHFRIDDCPATMTGIDMTGIGITDHYAVLLVCTPEYKNTYYVTSMAPGANSDQAEREMQAIIASFHVVKVAGSASTSTGKTKP